MKFNQIVILDNITFSNNILDDIQNYSQSKLIVYNVDPINNNEAIKRIGDADCILLSWRTTINEDIITNCPNLKYIGLCCTSFTKIDLISAKKQNIIVSNVTKYGDEGTAEFIFSQLLNLIRGFSKYQWKGKPAELNQKTIGLIGVGAVGKEVARIALGFNMKIFYTSKSRKPELEKKGLIYKELNELIKKVDIISMHVPRDLNIFSKEQFDLIPKGSIFINTCLGTTFDEEYFIEWINKKENYAIFDYSLGEEKYQKLKDLPNVIFSDAVAAITLEARVRLSKKSVNNIKAFLDNSSINVVNP